MKIYQYQRSLRNQPAIDIQYTMTEKKKRKMPESGEE